MEIILVKKAIQTPSNGKLLITTYDRKCCINKKNMAGQKKGLNRKVYAFLKLYEKVEKKTFE